MECSNEFDSPNQALPEIPRRVLKSFAAQSQLDFEIDFFTRIHRRNPGYVEVLQVLGNNLIAKGDFARGLEMDLAHVRLRPESELAHYNLACTYSLLGKVDLALDSLQRAVLYGYDDLTYLLEDRDLEAVRRDPRFGQFLQQLQRDLGGDEELS